MKQFVRMQKLAGINEITVNKPSDLQLNKTWNINSDQYKKFYQFLELCDYWNVDLGSQYDYDFDRDYDFFTAIHNAIQNDHWLPDRCIFTPKDFEELAANYAFDTIYYKDKDEEDIKTAKQIISKLKEHSSK
jgi:hypothetical protein